MEMLLHTCILFKHWYWLSGRGPHHHHPPKKKTGDCTAGGELVKLHMYLQLLPSAHITA